jgi:hypothetical protein
MHARLSSVTLKSVEWQPKENSGPLAALKFVVEAKLGDDAHPVETKWGMPDPSPEAEWGKLDVAANFRLHKV